MRIDEALAESKSLDVKFGTAVLHVEYRPPSYTIEEMVAADADKENPERLVKMIQDVVIGWDLTRFETVIVPGDHGEEIPTEREVPVDITNANDVRKYVPNTIIMGIVRAIRKDNEVSGD